MGVDLREEQDAGITLLEIAKLYKEYRPELSDKDALKLAILGNPKLGELYIGRPSRRDGWPEIKKFLMDGGPVPELREY